MVSWTEIDPMDSPKGTSNHQYQLMWIWLKSDLKGLVDFWLNVWSIYLVEKLPNNFLQWCNPDNFPMQSYINKWVPLTIYPCFADIWYLPPCSLCVRSGLSAHTQTQTWQCGLVIFSSCSQRTILRINVDSDSLAFSVSFAGVCWFVWSYSDSLSLLSVCIYICTVPSHIYLCSIYHLHLSLCLIHTLAYCPLIHSAPILDWSCCSQLLLWEMWHALLWPSIAPSQDVLFSYIANKQLSFWISDLYHL